MYIYIEIILRSTVRQKEQFASVICAIVLSVIITRSVSLLTLIFISEFHYSLIIEFYSIFKISEFEEPEEPNSRSFFSEIIGTISDVKFSHNGRYLLSRDYLTVKVWDLHMENKPIMSFQVSVMERLSSANFQS